MPASRRDECRVLPRFTGRKRRVTHYYPSLNRRQPTLHAETIIYPRYLGFFPRYSFPLSLLVDPAVSRSRKGKKLACNHFITTFYNEKVIHDGESTYWVSLRRFFLREGLKKRRIVNRKIDLLKLMQREKWLKLWTKIKAIKIKRNCRIYFTSPMKLEDFEGNLYKERHLVRVKVFLRCVTSRWGRIYGCDSRESSWVTKFTLGCSVSGTLRSF